MRMVLTHLATVGIRDRLIVAHRGAASEAAGDSSRPLGELVLHGANRGRHGG